MFSTPCVPCSSCCDCLSPSVNVLLHTRSRDFGLLGPYWPAPQSPHTNNALREHAAPRSHLSFPISIADSRDLNPGKTDHEQVKCAPSVVGKLRTARLPRTTHEHGQTPRARPWWTRTMCRRRQLCLPASMKAICSTSKIASP